MTVKMILLKTGETLIADAKEVVQEEQVRGYMLTQPQVIESQEKTLLVESETKNNNYELDVFLRPWMILSKSKEDRDSALEKLLPFRPHISAVNLNK